MRLIRSRSSAGFEVCHPSRVSGLIASSTTTPRNELDKREAAIKNTGGKDGSSGVMPTVYPFIAQSLMVLLSPVPMQGLVQSLKLVPSL